MYPNVLRKCTQQLLETADLIRNTNVTNRSISNDYYVYSGIGAAGNIPGIIYNRDVHDESTSSTTQQCAKPSRWSCP